MQINSNQSIKLARYNQALLLSDFAFPRFLLLGVCFAIGSFVCSAFGQTHPSSKTEATQATSDQATSDQPVTFDQASGGIRLSLAKIDLASFDLDSKQGQQLVQVYVADRKQSVLGQLTKHDQYLLFKPRFPFPTGVDYRVVFNRQWIDTTVEDPIEFKLSGKPTEDQIPATCQVLPNLNRFPQNVLKVYLQFDQPMRRGGYQHIHFEDSSGKRIEDAYLEIAEELWSRDGQRLTLLFDPGRIKRGLARHEAMGLAFQVGKSYTLVVSQDMKTRTGASLTSEIRKQFSIVDCDRTQPAINRWQIASPKTATRDPLTVTFDEPMDVAMLQHSLTITAADDQSVPGQVQVSKDGSVWEFHPDQPWTSGTFQLSAYERLEDLAGNSLLQPFERLINGDEPNEDRPSPPTTRKIVIE